MHLVDGFINAIFVFLSKETIVLNVVDEFKEEHSHAGVTELVFKR